MKPKPIVEFPDPLWTMLEEPDDFTDALKLHIERHGIYNPHTGRGVIKGLLPHGPHNIRDVLATHILTKDWLI